MMNVYFFYSAPISPPSNYRDPLVATGMNTGSRHPNSLPPPYTVLEPKRKLEKLEREKRSHPIPTPFSFGCKIARSKLYD
jgi:hypothetical protein